MNIFNQNLAQTQVALAEIVKGHLYGFDSV
jgi:hypothetical protein